MRTKPNNNPRPVGKTAAPNHVGSGVLLGVMLLMFQISLQAAQMLDNSGKYPLEIGITELQSTMQFGGTTQGRVQLGAGGVVYSAGTPPQFQSNLNRQVMPMLPGLLSGSKPRNNDGGNGRNQTTNYNSSEFSAHNDLLGVIIGAAMVWVGIGIGIYWAHILTPNDQS